MIPDLYEQLNNCERTSDAIQLIKDNLKTIKEIKAFAKKHDILISGNTKSKLIESLAYNVVGFKLTFEAIMNYGR